MKEYRLRLIETELDNNFKPIKTRSFENKYISTIPAADNLLLENLKKELFKKYYNEYFNTDKGFVKITNQIEKRTLDDKYICMWQKLKEWFREKIKEYEPTYNEWLAHNFDFYNKTKTQSIYKIVLDKMQELEAEDVED